MFFFPLFLFGNCRNKFYLFNLLEDWAHSIVIQYEHSGMLYCLFALLFICFVIFLNAASYFSCGVLCRFLKLLQAKIGEDLPTGLVMVSR